MASMPMVAIEATIISTVMPQIATLLGSLHLYSWIFASFLLAQTAMTVVFGKLSDIYGRRPVMFVGIAIFLLGSILADFAWSMPALICLRLLQGIGSGAIQPMGMTIVADLYPGRERGKVQGYPVSVWAVAAVRVRPSPRSAGVNQGRSGASRVRWLAMVCSSGPILQDAHPLQVTQVPHAGRFLWNAGVLKGLGSNDSDCVRRVADLADLKTVVFKTSSRALGASASSLTWGGRHVSRPMSGS